MTIASARLLWQATGVRYVGAVCIAVVFALAAAAVLVDAQGDALDLTLAVVYGACAGVVFWPRCSRNARLRADECAVWMVARLGLLVTFLEVLIGITLG